MSVAPSRLFSFPPCALQNARWRFFRETAASGDMLVLDTGRAVESTGYSAERVYAHLSHTQPARDTASELRALRAGGIEMSSMEMAVHQRVHAVLGHAAFASAALHLLPSTVVPIPPGFRRAVSPEAVAIDPLAVGVAENDPNGSPYIALAVHDALTECLVLSWCHQWTAFRALLRTSSLLPGDAPFSAAFSQHPTAVLRLLNAAESTGAVGSCANSDLR